MAWWHRFSASARKSADTLELFRQIFGDVPGFAGKSVTLKSALQVSTSLACGRAISEGMAMLPFKLMRQSGRSTLPAVDNPLYDKLAVSPNSLQTSFEFIETMGLHLAFCGNSYVWIDRVSRRIDEMWLLEPSWVTVKYSFGQLPTYEVRIPGGEILKLSADECWHVRGPSWISYLGLDFIKQAREALGLAMAIEEQQAGFYKNGAQPAGVLSVEGTLSDDQHKKLRKWLIENYQGSANAGVPMILDKAAKWAQAAMSAADAQTLESRKFMVEEVCRFFRVMPIMVGFSDKTATYASAEQMFIAHGVHTIGPWITRVEKSADKNLLSPEDRRTGLYTKFNEKALQRMTARDQMEYLARGTLSGILTRNEAREKLDLNPLDGLDDPLTPVNTFAGEPPRAPEPTAPPVDPAA